MSRLALALSIAACAALAGCHLFDGTGNSTGGLGGDATPSRSTASSPTLDAITAIAESSQCASTQWPNGRVPKAYTRGVALVFARAVCQPRRDYVRIVSAAAGSGQTAIRNDALALYDSRFRNLGMSNDSPGIDTLRHAYVLLMGLGAAESSGRYCSGRYMHDHYDQADSAESGLFQTSWGAGRNSAMLQTLFTQYASEQKGCLLNVFGSGVSCSPEDANNWQNGKGALSHEPNESIGVKWQRLTKNCPAFSTEYAAVVLRTSGGSSGEFGPIQRLNVRLEPACDAMLSQVQTLVQREPELCDLLD